VGAGAWILAVVPTTSSFSFCLDQGIHGRLR
jgi:hypothetical protein